MAKTLYDVTGFWREQVQKRLSGSQQILKLKPTSNTHLPSVSIEKAWLRWTLIKGLTRESSLGETESILFIQSIVVSLSEKKMEKNEMTNRSARSGL